LAATDVAFAVDPGPAEGKLDILAWPAYIERGESDQAYDWVTPFEKPSGCKVTDKTVDTSNEMVATMNPGGLDVARRPGATAQFS
jgi:putative spermidine/putrescine transport system substrate-binding protein